MDNLSANLHVITNACQKISRFMLRDFGEIEQLQSSINGAENFASASKIKIEKILIENLLEARPKYGVLSQTQEIKGLDISHRFIINVTDGFDNYVRGLPFFTVSVAIQEQKNLIAAVIYNPVLDKMYYAEKGAGTFVSESRMTRRVRVSQKRELMNSVVAESGKLSHFLTARVLDFGTTGLSLGYVASGMVDAFVGYEKNVFDLAAGFLIVKEAGGVIRAFDKDKKETDEIFSADMVVCGNSYLQSEIKGCIIKNK